MIIALMLIFIIAGLLGWIDSENAFVFVLLTALIPIASAAYKKIKLDAKNKSSIVPTIIKNWQRLLLSLKKRKNVVLKFLGEFLSIIEIILDGLLSLICFVDEILNENQDEFYRKVTQITEIIYSWLLKVLRGFIYLFDKSFQTIFYLFSVIISGAILLIHIFLPLILYNIQNTRLPVYFGGQFEEIFIPPIDVTDITLKIDAITIILLFIFVGICIFPILIEGLTSMSTIKRDLAYRNLMEAGPLPKSEETTNPKRKRPKIDSM